MAQDICSSLGLPEDAVYDLYAKLRDTPPSSSPSSSLVQEGTPRDVQRGASTSPRVGRLPINGLNGSVNNRNNGAAGVVPADAVGSLSANNATTIGGATNGEAEATTSTDASDTTGGRDDAGGEGGVSSATSSNSK